MYNSRVKATISFLEKMSFSLKLFSGHFYGQPFIKTVRGPFYGHSPSADSRRVIVSYKQKMCMKYWLTNHLVKLTKEKSVVR